MKVMAVIVAHFCRSARRAEMMRMCISILIDSSLVWTTTRTCQFCARPSVTQRSSSSL